MPTLNPTHQDFLYRCIFLAHLGGTSVHPNPMVGSVIVHDNKIIGEGYHQQYGGPHAEVNAVRSVQNRDLLSNSTIYVSLEPCNHFGNTPPCVDLILENKIPKVVIGCLDPNPKVSGKGMARLQEGGVEVILSDNQQPFIDLNKAFFTNQNLKRPYITLKWAETSDRFIAKFDKNRNPQSIAITGHQSNTWVHKLRATHHAIMVGRNTASIDNPGLTTRHFYGNDPIRLVWDRKSVLANKLKLFSDGGDTIVISDKKDKESDSVQVYQPSSWNDLRKITSELYQEHNICSILVEGGTNIHQQFLDQNLYDELYIFRSEQKIGNGISAPDLPEGLQRIAQPGKDRLFHKKNTASN